MYIEAVPIAARPAILLRQSFRENGRVGKRYLGHLFGLAHSLVRVFDAAEGRCRVAQRGSDIRGRWPQARPLRCWVGSAIGPRPGLLGKPLTALVPLAIV